MKILKRTDIEAIGNRVYAAYQKLPKIAEQRMICAVDPDILLTDLLGLRVDYRHLSIDRRIYGATSTRAVRVMLCQEEFQEDFYFLDGKTILIETDLQKDSLMAGKCRFTKCHEASHHIYKMLYPQFYGYNDDETDPVLHFSREPEKRTGIITDWEEWQADVLASCLLLPEELVRQGMYQIGLGEKVECLNRIYCPDVYAKVNTLAQMLGSSITALANKMQRHGLLDRNQLHDPYEYWGVYIDIPHTDRWRNDLELRRDHLKRKYENKEKMP